MGAGTCDRPGCTVADTGICLLSHSQLQDCPHFRPRIGDETAAIPNAGPEGHGPDSMILPSYARQFPGGLELGADDAAKIMRGCYAHLLGILGFSDAGKTSSCSPST